MEFQCFKVKPEEECPHDDKPCTGMFAGSDEHLLFMCTAFALMFQSFYFQTKFTLKNYYYTYCVLTSHHDDYILCAVELFVVANPV